MGIETTSRNNQVFTVPAGGTVQITDKDGIRTDNLVGLILELGGTNGRYDDITALRISGKQGFAYNVTTMALYTAWADRMEQFAPAIAAADGSLLIPFYTPDQYAEKRYQSAWPRGSGIQIEITGTVGLTIRVATLHVTDLEMMADKGAGKYFRRLNQVGFSYGNGTDQENTFATEGKVRSLTFSTTNINRIKIDDPDYGGTIHDLRTAQLLKLQAVQGGPATATGVLHLDPDGDEKGMFKATKDKTKLVLDTGAAAGYNFLIEELVPRQ